MAAAGLSVSVGERARSCTVVVQGDLDASNASQLRDCLTELLSDDTPPAEIVLDVADLAFIDSSGLSALAHGYRLAGDTTTLVIQDPRPHVRRVLEVTGMAQLFDIRS